MQGVKGAGGVEELEAGEEEDGDVFWFWWGVWSHGGGEVAGEI